MSSNNGTETDSSKSTGAVGSVAEEDDQPHQTSETTERTPIEDKTATADDVGDSEQKLKENIETENIEKDKPKERDKEKATDDKKDLMTENHGLHVDDELDDNDDVFQEGSDSTEHGTSKKKDRRIKSEGSESVDRPPSYGSRPRSVSYPMVGVSNESSRGPTLQKSSPRRRGESSSQTPRTEEEWLRIIEETGELQRDGEAQVFVPKRYLLLFMTFLGFVNIYSLRVNLNVAIVAMVNNKTVVLHTGEIQYEVAEFQWESHLQGIVLGSFYYGYWILQIPGAWIAMKLGGTRVFGYGVLLASLLALITPVATRYSVYALIGVRVFQGLFLGVTFPTNHAIWSKWAPPLERSTLVTMAIAGCPVGNIIAIPVTGILSKYGFDGGWPSVFYFFGCLGVLWYLLWEFTAYQSPAHHPTISNAEKDFIENSIGEKAFDPMKESLPWLAIMTSIPMWAIIFGHFGACWGYYTLFTQMPTYLKDIQHLDIKTMGLVAATPYILKAFVGPIGGISADLIVRRKWLTLRGVRALFYGVGCFLAGGFILMTGYCVRQGDAIAMLILGVGFSGLNATGYAVNHLDIGPRYAGVLMGISNTFATIPGFLSPMLTGMITKNKTPGEWKAVFWVTFIVYIVCVGLYSVMCSGEKQPWAEVPIEDEEKTEEK